MLTPLLNAATKVLNQSLQISSQAQDLAKTLEQQSLAISVMLTAQSEPVRVRCLINQGQFLLLKDQERASTSVMGSPLALLKLTGSELAKSLTARGAQIEGDAEIAKRFEMLFKSLPIDIEAVLAKKVGDKPAYIIGQLVTRGFRMAARQAKALARQSSEYLTEEANILVPSTRANEFTYNVERLRDDAERLQARLRLLEKRFQS